jgi:small-conductance mechanosensitive channel
MESFLDKLIIPSIVGGSTAAALVVVRFLLFRLLGRWAARTETRMDDVILEVFRRPTWLWCLLIGLHVALSVSELEGRYAVLATKAILVLVGLSVTITLARLAVGLLENYTREAKLPMAASGLVFGVIRWGIILVGIVVTLGFLGVSVAPILTALGVGGLAVALALQDTLANLFAGIHILMDKNVRVGDCVRLESGQEGYVEDISWRTTRIRMLADNIVVIPNSKLAQSVLVNFSLPGKTMSVPVPVSVAYGTDAARVERVLQEEARKAVGEVPGLAPGSEPAVRLNPGFGESALGFTVFVTVEEFSAQYPAVHELRKRILERFRAEGIEIPFPQRVVHLKDGRGPSAG